MKKNTILILLLSTICSTLIYGQNSLSKGLIAYFPFSGSASDSIKSYTDITESNTTLTTDKNGNPNSAYSFNGSSSRIYSPITGTGWNTSTLDGISISMWVNLTDFGTTDSRLLDFNITNPGYVYDFNVASTLRNEVGKINFLNYDSYVSANRISYWTNASLTTANWSHIVFNIDQKNNSTQTFINGNLVGSSSTTIYKPTLNGICIGNHVVNNWGFNGAIDEVRIYGRTLNNLEIAGLYKGYDNPVTACSTTDGLVVYYPFSGDASDKSGNNLNATITGASLATDKINQSNSAYSFNGANKISTSNTSLLNFTSPGVTLSAWVYPLQTSNLSARLIDKTTVGGNNGYLLDIYGYTPKFRFVGSHTTQNPVSNYTVVINTWQHITVSYNLDSVKFYINGVLDKSAKGNKPLTLNNLPLIIGQDQDGYNGFIGKIDEVRVYNRAMSNCEISQLYSAALPSGGIPTDVPTDSKSYKSTIYPNPSNGTFNIDIENQSIQRIEIIHISGQKVFETSSIENVKIHGLTTGMYVLKALGNQGEIVFTEKLIVE